MMKQKFFILITTLLPFFSFSQSDSIVVINDTISYAKLNEPIGIKGLTVLLGYNGGNGATDIPKTFEHDSILVIVVDAKSWFLPDNDIIKIDTCIRHALKSNQLDNKSLMIGGFSDSGVKAVRYVEKVVEENKLDLIPRCLFVGDAPLDHLKFYNYCVKEITRTCDAPNSIWGKRECNYIKNEYDSILGDPIKDRNEYIKASAVTISEPNFGNAKYLLSVPIRSYHEPDAMWLIKERCRSIIDENIVVGSELINYLYNNGNKKAEIIITQDKGYRTNGMRQPHSWSIINAKELLIWYKNI